MAYGIGRMQAILKGQDAEYDAVVDRDYDALRDQHWCYVSLYLKGESYQIARTLMPEGGDVFEYLSSLIEDYEETHGVDITPKADKAPEEVSAVLKIDRRAEREAIYADREDVGMF